MPREARKANRDWRAFVSECLDPVEGGYRWWNWRRWEGCGQELGDLGSKIPVEWMAAVRAGPSPSEPLDTLPSEEQASKVLVPLVGWRTSGSTKCGWGRPCRLTMYDSGVQKRICCLWQKRWGGPRTHRG